MKSIMYILSLSAVILLALPAAAKNDLAFVDLERAINETEEGKAEYSKLKADFDKKQAQLDKRAAKLKKMQADFEKSYVAPEGLHPPSSFFL